DHHLDRADARPASSPGCASAGTRGDAVTINDAHCHFFSSNFFGALARQRFATTAAPGAEAAASAADICRQRHRDDPRAADVLADRWVAELDEHGVTRAALIASVPTDEVSVAEAVA